VTVTAGPDLITAVLAELNPSHNLLVDEVRCDSVGLRIVPRRKDLLAEEQSPRRIALRRSLLLGVLFTLRYSVHDVVTTTAQRRNLGTVL